MSPDASLVLALDQGTTSSRAVIVDPRGRIVAAAQQEFEQHFPRPGWVEHDADDLWRSQHDVLIQAIDDAGVSPREIAAIGITNQRETTLLWDRQTGRPLGPAIVWQDRRTADFCAALRHAGHETAVVQTTGLVLDPYFSASKLRWLLDHTPGAREAATAGRLAFGTVDTWLAWKLSGGQAHVTDVSNASRTLLMNLRSGQWDRQMLDLFDVPPSVLPRIVASSGVAGMATCEPFSDHPLPIAGIAGDQQAALFGHACFERGQTKNTYGTGCFMLMNVGGTPRLSGHRLLSTRAWQLGAESNYALEGSVFVGGAVVQWLRDGLGIVKSAAEIEPLAASVADTGGVVVVPAFAGLGAPHWDAAARGTIIGITRGTTAAHIARAALESIAHQVADVLDVMHADAGHPPDELRVDGGASQNNLLMQFQADLLGVPVARAAQPESTALGAAYLAGLATGVWGSTDEIARLRRVDRTFTPSMPPQEVASRRHRWTRALQRSRDWEVGQD